MADPQKQNAAKPLTDKEHLLERLGLGLTSADWLSNLALDTRIMRMFSIGPYELFRYRPADVGIAVPLSISPQQTLTLVGPVDGPAAVIFFGVTATVPTFFLQAELDKVLIDINTEAAMNQEIDTLGAGPALFMPQADYANGLFSLDFVPGSPQGLPFFDSAKLSIRNSSTASIFLVDFYIAVRYVKPLEGMISPLLRERRRQRQQ